MAKSKVRTGHVDRSERTTNQRMRGGVTVTQRKYKDAFTHYDQPRDTYLSTQDLADVLGIPRRTAIYWAEGWFGQLPPGRRGSGLGYRLPHSYVKVGRLWMRTNIPAHREAGREAILTEPERNFVLVTDRRIRDETVTGTKLPKEVAAQATSHYSIGEALEQLERLLPLAVRREQSIHLYHVGE